jgi:hypothetical protein
MMRTKHALHANWNITLLAMALTSLVGVKFTLRKCHLSVFEMNDVMWLVFELVHVFTNTVHTQTELTAVTILPGRLVTKVTGDDILCLGVGCGHSAVEAGIIQNIFMNKEVNMKSINNVWILFYLILQCICKQFATSLETNSPYYNPLYSIPD